MKMEQDPRFKHIEAFIGAFVVGAVIAAIAVVFYFGTDIDLFDKKYLLKFESDTGAGLNKGMPVKLSGFLIGRIHKVSLDDRAKVLVEILVDRKYSKWVRVDSSATMMQEGLIGTSIIDISVGSPNLPPLEEGQFIRFHKQDALNEIALGMRESVDILLNEVYKTISYVNDPQGDIKLTMANIERLTSDFEKTRSHADRLFQTGINDAEKAAVLIDNLSVMANTLSLVADNVSQRLPILIDKAEEALSNMENTSLLLRKTAEQTAPRFYPLLIETEEFVSNTNDIVGGIKKMWPFRNYIPAEGKPGIVPGDSHE
ncbi:MAG: MlaD family protein [Syntrophorhabdaceae bacterium]|nr:MlaD family protein [Syntrophorhabdaceae bacterium]